MCVVFIFVIVIKSGIMKQKKTKQTGVLVNMREMDDVAGKCAELHREAVELYESLRWYLSFVNQKSGQVASRIVKNSFVPGIQIGTYGSRDNFRLSE